MKRISYPSLVMYSALLIILTFFSISITTTSCKKMDIHVMTDAEIQSRFFNVPANASAAVRKVADALKNQNDIGRFIPSFAKTEGYAIWDKSQIYTTKALTRTYGRNGENETNDATEVFIPIVLDEDNIVNGFFFSRIVGDSVALHLYRANDFDMFPNGKADTSFVTAEMIALKLLRFNEDIFGVRKLQLSDTNLFKTTGIRSNFRTIETDTSLARMAGVHCGYICYYTVTPECISTTSVCSNCQLVGCISEYCIPPPLSGGYNWPPDPPIATGAGGTGGSTTGNCTTGNCRPYTTLLAEGRLPCGGCGSGPMSIPIPTTQPPLADSCQLLINIGKKMDTLYMKGKVDSMLTTFTGWQEYVNEKGFAIMTDCKKVGSDTLVMKHFVSNVVTGTDSSLELVADIEENHLHFFLWTANAHVHPKKGYSCPSPSDIYNNLILNSINEPRFEGIFVISAHGDKYAMAVTNKSQALTFNNTKSQYLDGIKWNANSIIGKSFTEAQKYFFEQYKSFDTTTRRNLAYQMAMASVLKEFNTGITLFKQDQNGNFKPVGVRTSIPNPNKPKKRSFIVECPYLPNSVE